MGSYRYIVADTITGQPLDELPLSVNSFSNQLGVGGDLTATLALGNGALTDWRAVTEAGKTSLYVLRGDGELVVWGGPIVSCEPADDAGTVASIRAITFEQWLKEHRKIKTDLSYTSDVFSIVRDMVDVVQGHLGGNLNLAVSSGLAGYSQTYAIEYSDRAGVWDEIMRLSEVGDTFEAWITCDRDASTNWFTKTLNLATPQANTALPPIMLEYPGNVVEHPKWPQIVGANAVAGLGKGDGTSKLIYEAVDAAGQIADGYPLCDADLSLGEEDDLTRLTARTKVDLARRLVDSVVPQVTVSGDAEGLEFGSYPLGVPARLRVTSLFHPPLGDGSPSVDVLRRVTGWTVNPPSGGIEKVALALSAGAGKITPPVDEKAFRRWLKLLEKRVGTIETRR